MPLESICSIGEWGLLLWQHCSCDGIWIYRQSWTGSSTRLEEVHVLLRLSIKPI